MNENDTRKYINNNKLNMNLVATIEDPIHHEPSIGFGGELNWILPNSTSNSNSENKLNILNVYDTQLTFKITNLLPVYLYYIIYFKTQEDFETRTNYYVEPLFFNTKTSIVKYMKTDIFKQKQYIMPIIARAIYNGNRTLKKIKKIINIPPPTIIMCDPSLDTSFFRHLFGEPINQSKIIQRYEEVYKFMKSHTALNFSIEICKISKDMSNDIYSHIIVKFGNIKCEYYNTDTIDKFADKVEHALRSRR